MTVVVGVDMPGTGERVLELRCRADRKGIRHHLLVGELCAYTAPFVTRFLDAEPLAGGVVLDTSGVSFVDSHGLDACLELAERWRARGRAFEVVNPSAEVCRLVSILAWEERLFGPTARRRVAAAHRPRSSGSPAEPTRSPDHAVTPDRATDSAAISVRNLERGQVIEVEVVGRLAPAEAASLAHRLGTLSAKREPAVLRVDLSLARSTSDPQLIEALGRAADVLDQIGSRLELVGPDPALVAAIRRQERARSLTVAPAPGG